MPRVDKLYKQYRDQGLAVIAIDFENRRESGLGFIAENDLSILFLIENWRAKGSISGSLFKAGPFPYTYIIDGEGRILFFHGNFVAGDEEKFEKEIKWILGS